MNPDLNRRTFLGAGAGAAGLGYFFTATAASAQRTGRKPNETLQVAGIGVGGKGSGDIDQAGKIGEVVALCDVDEGTLKKKAEKFSSAKTFYDFRTMYDKMSRQIDAVTVSTPDHSHALAALTGIRLGKHVYCQKPLAHSVFECRVLKEAARQHNVCTQMGNQGSAENGLRRAVELIQSGFIGDVKEVHVWTNRPVWPQAPKVTKRPDRADVWPDSLHWDEFLAGAPLRPYVKKYGEDFAGYHPFNWRGWLDFGTGAIGDMACHTANMAFRALKLAYPSTISAKSGEVNDETYPGWAHVTLEFPSREDLPPVTLNWYEGHRDGKLVLPPEDLQSKVLSEGKKLTASGSILVGEKGILYSPDDYGAKYFVTPKELVEGKNLDHPEKLPSNGKGDQGMKNEWFEAIKAGKPEIAYSNFDIASLLTEAFLLGNVAIRCGKTLHWDGPGLKVTNVPEANHLIQTEYRRGWEVTRS
ncbi:MAG: Gfo/Idh/MocA family oxidoreductase [Planctomycetia bacterium]|nr:Gfo/Idh/MocA family oxidoreductase [Planctomycetia bacterium]